ncbi:MAG: hypothetical protein IJ206_12700, partial [Oscillospiraceae bacterium]|nr:hypothetical protein [Oscillospiraceae bacterium]
GSWIYIPWNLGQMFARLREQLLHLRLLLAGSEPIIARNPAKRNSGSDREQCGSFRNRKRTVEKDEKKSIMSICPEKNRNVTIDLFQMEK